jgi:hypothetical protein
MSTPRDRDGSEDLPDDGSGWHEPAHLGDEQGSRGGEKDEPPPPSAWEPPGWDLPTADPQGRNRPDLPPRAWTGYEYPEPPIPARPGLFRRRSGGGAIPEQLFGYQGDQFGAQTWALQHGWTVSDGSGPQDAGLGELVTSAPPMRVGKESRPAGVLRGRYGSLDLVAFDIVHPSGRLLVPQFAVTAAPTLATVPGIRLSPARLWKHRTGALVPVTSGNEVFDGRWQLLAVEDGPQVRRLAQDPTVQGLLLGTDDGDEFWSTPGYVAAIRPDGHRPQLIEHHARLLTAIVGALAAGS